MRGNIQIREARPEEAEVLAAAQRRIAAVPGRLASTPAEIHDDAVRERIARLQGGARGKFLVATQGEEIVAHALVDPLKLHVTLHVVDLTMVVHEGWSGQGLGTALLAALIGWARAHPHVERIELRVRSSNAPAIALYRKMGFAEEGRMVKRIKLASDLYVDDLVMGLWVGD